MVRESEIKQSKNKKIEKKPVKVSKKKYAFDKFSGDDDINLES
jgi:hypothetical protein